NPVSKNGITPTVRIVDSTAALIPKAVCVKYSVESNFSKDSNINIVIIITLLIAIPKDVFIICILSLPFLNKIIPVNWKNRKLIQDYIVKERGVSALNNILHVTA